MISTSVSPRSLKHCQMHFSTTGSCFSAVPNTFKYKPCNELVGFRNKWMAFYTVRTCCLNFKRPPITIPVSTPNHRSQSERSQGIWAIPRGFVSPSVPPWIYKPILSQYLPLFLLKVIRELEAHRLHFLCCSKVFYLYFYSEISGWNSIWREVPSLKPYGNSILWTPKAEKLWWLLADRVNFILTEYNPGAKKL